MPLVYASGEGLLFVELSKEEKKVPKQQDEEYLCDRADLLDMVQDREWFVEFVRAQFRLAFLPIRTTPLISSYRLHDAYDFWQDDIKRVSEREYGGADIDEFKTFAHMAYWIRRTSPCVEVMPRQTEPQYGDVILSMEEERRYKEKVYKYANEYVAFDLSYRACRYLHVLSKAPEKRLSEYRLSERYISTVCRMLKAKNVSPHAIYLILLSLFER